jgi:transcriptional regulator with XRE-family HTH domain
MEDSLPKLIENLPTLQSHVNTVLNFPATISDEMPDENFAELIRSELARKGMSQTKFAEVIGISRERVSQMVTDRGKRPNGEVLRRVAEALDIPLPRLYAALGEPLPVPDNIDPDLLWVLSLLSDEGQEMVYRIALSLLPTLKRSEPGEEEPDDIPPPPGLA